MTVEQLQALGADQVIVDGAINRIGSASPRVSDGVVVATGGMVGDTLEDVLETTSGALDLLLLPGSGPRRVNWWRGTPPLARVPSPSPAEAWPTRSSSRPWLAKASRSHGVERLGADTLLVGGALTQEFVDDFTRVLPPRTELRVIVRDATVLVLPPAMVGRFLRRGIRLEVLTPLRVLALTVNPFRVPQPYQPRVFFSAVADAVGDRVPCSTS